MTSAQFRPPPSTAPEDDELALAIVLHLSRARLSITRQAVAKRFKFEGGEDRASRAVDRLEHAGLISYVPLNPHSDQTYRATLKAYHVAGIQPPLELMA